MKDSLLKSSAAFVGPVGSEGGRSPSTLSIGQAVPTGGLAPGQRWSVCRKREVVLRLLRGEAAESLSRELGVYRARFFGHKFDLSGVVHGGLLPGETRLTRAA